MSRVPAVAWQLGTLLLIFGLAGCAVHALATYYDRLRDGDLAAAEEKLGDIPERRKNEVLIKMHYALLRQLEQRYVDSNGLLEDVKRQSEELAPLSLSESAAALAINDAVQSYSGSIFERVMVYCSKYMNYVALRQFNEARIEMRQAELMLREWRRELSAFPYLPFLVALAYEALGQEDNALVAYRRSLEAYGDQIPLVVKQSYIDLLYRAGRRRELAEQEERLGLNANPAPASLIVFGTSGLVSRREAFSVYHIHPETGQSFFVSLPTYGSRPYQPSPPSVQIDAAPVDFELLLDLEQEMRAALAEDMPILILRALTRALIKQQAQRAVDQQDNSLLSLGFLVARVATAVADTRSWDSLPGALYIARVPLAPGDYQTRTHATTRVYVSVPEQLTIRQGVNFALALAR